MAIDIPSRRRRRPPPGGDADGLDALDRLIRLGPPATARGGWMPVVRTGSGRHSRPDPTDDDESEPADSVEQEDRPPGAGLLFRLAVRLGVTRRQVLLVVILAIAACAFAAVQAFQHRAKVTYVPVTTIAAPSPAVSTGRDADPGPTAAATVMVHVVGRVARPGVVRVRTGSRVADAVAAAGGPARGADLSTVNLARVVTDGEQVVVGTRASGPVAPSTAAPNAVGPAAGSGGRVNLNTASLTELDGLPHIGPVLALRILDFRSEHGRFSSVDELNEVTGIGEKTFADLQPLVTV